MATNTPLVTAAATPNAGRSRRAGVEPNRPRPKAIQEVITTIRVACASELVSLIGARGYALRGRLARQAEFRAITDAFLTQVSSTLWGHASLPGRIRVRPLR